MLGVACLNASPDAGLGWWDVFLVDLRVCALSPSTSFGVYGMTLIEMMSRTSRPSIILLVFGVLSPAVVCYDPCLPLFLLVCLYFLEQDWAVLE